MPDDSAHLPEDVLTSYLLGMLYGSELMEVEDHLTVCDQCEAVAAQSRPRDALMDLLEAAAKTEVVADLRTLGANNTQANSTADNDTPPEPTPPDGHQASDIESIPPQLLSHNRYKVIRLLGSGGMGSVWLAEHLVLGRQVALKMLHNQLMLKPGTVNRFYREIRAAGRLNHPNIASVHDAEQIGESHFLVMEYVEGQTMSDVVHDGPLPITDACRAVRDAALGLDCAHAARLIHRDIKPANLIRTPSGEVKILDFGLVVGPDDPSSLTAPNLVIGTPDYISPEQAEEPHDADERSDLYSLGCTLYHLLSGSVPFPETSVLRKIDGHRFTDPAPISSIPDALWSVVAKLMSKSPADRFQSAIDVVTALHPFCDSAMRSTTSQPTAAVANENIQPVRRGWSLPVIGLSAALLLMAGIVAFEFFQKIKPTNTAGAGSPLRTASEETDPVPVYTEWVHRLTGHQAVIRCARFSPDSARLFSGSDDGTVRVWDVASGTQTGLLNPGGVDGDPVRIFGITLVDDAATLISSQDDRLRSWDIDRQTERPLRFDSVTPDQLTGIDANTDETLVAAGSTSGVVRVWDVTTGQMVFASDSLSQRPNYAVHWIPGRDAILASDDNFLAVIDRKNPQRQVIADRPAGFISVAVSPDGKRMGGMTWNHHLLLFRSETDTLTAEFDTSIKGDSGSLRFRFLTDGRIATSGRDNRFTDLWDRFGRTRLATLAESSNSAAVLAVSADAKWLATGDNSNGILIWRVPVEQYIEP